MIFLWKEKNMNFELDYKENDLPPTFHKENQNKPAKLMLSSKTSNKSYYQNLQKKILKVFPDQK